MAEIKLELDELNNGAFNLYEDGHKLGEMVLSISKGQLTVYHNEVAPEAEGKGFAKQLLGTMVTYAREHQLKVVPLCPYVHAQFKRHPELYEDVWQKA
ncbi:MAG TPA: GNAT family N-acetyltransferase [Arachidicoccus sp.]